MNDLSLGLQLKYHTFFELNKQLYVARMQNIKTTIGESNLFLAVIFF